MNLPYLFTSGLIVVILLLIGLTYTFWEFRKMNQHPGEYTDAPDKNVTIEQKKSR
jgi:hypothetical protein